jgi:hypothetical protein
MPSTLYCNIKVTIKENISNFRISIRNKIEYKGAP